MVANCQWVLGIRCGFSAKANNAFNCRVSFPALSFHLLMPSSKADSASCISNVANSGHSSAGALFSGQSDYHFEVHFGPTPEWRSIQSG